MARKIWPWAIFIALSTVAPCAHFIVTGHPIQPVTPYWLFDVVFFTAATYWWYLADKKQRNFKTGGTQNIAVVFLTLIGLPVYFIRSRGWLKGILATIMAVLVFVGLGTLGLLSELAGQKIASMM
jgi:hypothetical protein